MRSIDPVYLPEVRQLTALGNHSYPCEYYVAGSSRVTLEMESTNASTARQRTRTDAIPTVLNCGSINCPSHIKTERLEDEPICTGCAVTERFALKTKYFSDEASRESLREEHAEMPVYGKATENKRSWAAGS